MSNVRTDHEEAAEQLRFLAATAAPAIRARADLATVVLARGRTRSKQVRRRWILGAAAALTAAAVVGATPPGQGHYFVYQQPSASMEPTVMVSQRVIVAKRLTPQRGDVVAYRFPFAQGDQTILRRVVGVAGDRISCPDAGAGLCSALVVNGRRVPEAYLRGAAGRAFAETTVPAGQLFLLGDNRDASNDFRTPVPEKFTQGVLVRILDHAGRQRVVPGAPSHRGPTPDDIDQQAPVPPARSVSAPPG